LFRPERYAHGQGRGLPQLRAEKPGVAGEYAGLDMSLVKNWKMPYNESHSIQFRWEVFNVPNLTRFNAQSIGSSSLLTSLTQPRVTQFALRYEF
jgi:hypothetical protein